MVGLGTSWDVLSIKAANEAAALEAVHSLTLQMTSEYILDAMQSKEATKFVFKCCSGLPTSVSGR